jgi:hypothetical protein
MIAGRPGLVHQPPAQLGVLPFFPAHTATGELHPRTMEIIMWTRRPT